MARSGRNATLSTTCGEKSPAEPVESAALRAGTRSAVVRLALTPQHPAQSLKLVQPFKVITLAGIGQQLVYRVKHHVRNRAGLTLVGHLFIVAALGSAETCGGGVFRQTFRGGLAISRRWLGAITA